MCTDQLELNRQYQRALEERREAREAVRLANALWEAREKQVREAWDALVAVALKVKLP